MYIKAYNADECLNKFNEIEGKVDVIFVNGQIGEDRGAMLIVKICVVAEDETIKTRVLD